MLEKRGKGWLVRIYLGKGEDGKKKYFTQMIYAPTKHMAREIEASLKKRLVKPDGYRGAVYTLGEWLDAWLAETKDTVSSRTYKEYESHVRKLKPLVGDLFLYSLQAEVLSQRLAGQFNHLRPKTRKNLYSTLKTVIRAAIERKLAPYDALVGFKLPKVPREIRRTLSRDELKRLVEAAKEHKHGLIIRMLAVTGARLGEILGLTWDCVDFERGTITIEKSVDTKHRVLKGDVKTPQARRTVELDEETITLLRNHAPTGKIVPIHRHKNSLVFQAEDGRPVKYEAVRKTLHKALQKAGLPTIRIHDIRHSVVTLLLSEGVPPILVANLVGHKVGTTVNCYAQQVSHGKGLQF